jgi:hypothetical protein
LHGKTKEVKLSGGPGVEREEQPLEAPGGKGRQNPIFEDVCIIVIDSKLSTKGRRKTISLATLIKG